MINRFCRLSRVAWVMIAVLGIALASSATAQNDCPMPGRLVDGLAGIVLYTDGSPLNMRDGASTGNTVIASIPEGAIFEVTGTATCNGGIQWYPITFEQQSGWIAEGVDDTYFVAPVGIPLADVIDDDAGPEVDVIPRPQAEGDFINSNRNANGTQIAWLFDQTPVDPTDPIIDGCRADEGCVGLVYELIITDGNGDNATSVWIGTIDSPFPKISIEKWIGDDVVIRERPVQVASLYFNVRGSSRSLIDSQTGEETAIDNPINAEEILISPDGEWIASIALSPFAIHVQNTATGEVYSQPYTDEDGNRTLTGNLSFSPDSQFLVWSQVRESEDFTVIDASLNVVDLQTFEVQTLFRLAESQPQDVPRSLNEWLTDTIAIVYTFEATHYVDVVTGIRYASTQSE